MGETTGRPIDRGTGPAREVATLIPDQGQWEEEDYLELKTNRLVELSDGFIEVVPWPTTSHQRTLGFLAIAVDRFVTPGGIGVGLFAPLPVRLRPRTFRMPDLMFILSEHRYRMRGRYLKGADLVMEVVSEDGLGIANGQQPTHDDERQFRCGRFAHNHAPFVAASST